jgi:hypothetical protein
LACADAICVSRTKTNAADKNMMRERRIILLLLEFWMIALNQYIIYRPFAFSKRRHSEKKRL